MSFPNVDLGSIVTFLDNLRQPITEKNRLPGPVPYYGANGQQDSVAGYIFDEPLVLLAEDGGHFDQPEKGVAYRISGRTWVNNHAHVLRPSPEIDIHYLCRVLENRNLMPFISGSTRGKLTKGSAERIPIPLPPLPEQRRIAEILDRADELRTTRRRTLALLDELADSAIDSVVHEAAAPSIELGDVCVRITDGTHQAPKWAPDGVPFIFVSNVITGRIDFTTDKFVSEATYDDLTRGTPIEVGDVLYTAVGSYGVPAVVEDGRKFVFQRHIAQLKPRHDILDSQFLRGVLASVDLRRQADRVARGVAQKTITLGEISKLRIPLLPIDVQREFARFVGRLEDQRELALTHLATLDELFASLQRRAFTGQL